MKLFCRDMVQPTPQRRNLTLISILKKKKSIVILQLF